MAIRYLKNAAIDKDKWDECILKATNSLIYVHSFYLDNCTNHSWDALIIGDYETVMPVTFRKKYGISYLYQPAFLQQAGIFSKKEIDINVIDVFVSEIMDRFKFAEINLNYANTILKNQNIVIAEKNNFILPLKNSFTYTAANFKGDFKRNVIKAEKNKLSYQTDAFADNLIELYETLYGSRFPFVKRKDYAALKKNCSFLQTRNDLIVRTAHKSGEILAGIILLKDRNRLYNVASSITENGRKLSANHFLFNKVIEEFSNQNLVLDLEGSDLKGIADFYTSMNPFNEKYVSIKYNNLSKFIKFFKK